MVLAGQLQLGQVPAKPGVLPGQEQVLGREVCKLTCPSAPNRVAQCGQSFLVCKYGSALLASDFLLIRQLCMKYHSILLILHSQQAREPHFHVQPSGYIQQCPAYLLDQSWSVHALQIPPLSAGSSSESDVQGYAPAALQIARRTCVELRSAIQVQGKYKQWRSPVPLDSPLSFQGACTVLQPSLQ